MEDSDIVKCLGEGVQRHVELIRAVEKSGRFGSVTFRNYAEILDYENSIQFAAAAFGYKDSWNFIA